MKTVDIGELHNQLSACLEYVRDGEEIVVNDGTMPVARISPIREGDSERDYAAEQAQLVASGDLTLPERKMDWEAFWAMPRANVPHDIAVQAVIDSRGDR